MNDTSTIIQNNDNNPVLVHKDISDLDLNDIKTRGNAELDVENNAQQDLDNTKSLEKCNKEDLIEFSENDPDNPFNWSLKKKSFVFVVVTLNMYWTLGLSTLYVPAASIIGEEFGFHGIVTKLPIFTYIMGFSFGPVMFISLSEDYGRKPIGMISLFVLYIFQIPQILAKNIETIIICRFISGLVASPILNYVCCIPDMFSEGDKVGLWAINLWALGAESVILSSIMGAYIVDRLHWRWIFYVTLIVGVPLWLLFCILPETRPAPILKRRAKHIRRTVNPHAWTFYEVQKRSLKEIFNEVVLRPCRMLFTEPIITFSSIYDGVNYALIYMILESGPLVFEQFGIDSPNSSLANLSIQIGFLLAILAFWVQLKLQDIAKEREGQFRPEHKLFWGMIAGLIFPVSMYLYAWTGRNGYTYWLPILAIGMFGFSSHILFMIVSDYTIDSYGIMASSAVTGQSFCREMFAAVGALITEVFYKNVGYPWASTILAIIASVLAIIPFAFYKFGPYLRSKSPFTQAIKNK